MYIRKKIKYRIAIVVVLALIFIYWRGVNASIKENKLNCQWHFAYAICSSKAKATKIPSMIDVFKAGINF